MSSGLAIDRLKKVTNSSLDCIQFKTESQRYKTKPREKMEVLNGFSTPVAECTLPFRRAKHDSIGPSNRSTNDEYNQTDSSLPLLNRDTNVIGISPKLQRRQNVES